MLWNTTHRFIRRMGLSAALAAMLTGCGAPGAREYSTGVRELQRGRAVRAKDLLDKSIQLRPGHPDNVEAYNHLGLARVELGELDAAARAFDEARRLNPSFAAPSYNLGCLYRRTGDLDTALAYFAESARLDPADARPIEMMGRIACDRRQWDHAASLFQTALEIHHASPRILASIAEVEMQRRGPKVGALYLMKALEADRRYAPALYNLYVIHAFALDNPDEGEPYARRFLEAAGPDTPQSAGVRAWLDARRAAAGREASAKPDATPPEATAAGPPTPPDPGVRPPEVPSAALPAPTSPPPPITSSTPPAPPRPPPSASAPPPVPPTADQLLSQARLQAEAEKPSAALTLCLEAAAIFESKGDAASQTRALRTAVDLARDLPDAHLALGRLLLRLGHATEASRSFAQAVTLSPTNAVAHVELARAFVAADDPDAAVLSLRNAMQRRIVDPDAQWLLATINDEKLGLASDAAREYRRFMERFPGDSRALLAGERARALDPTTPEPPPADRPAAEVPPPAPVSTRAGNEPAPPAVPPSTGRRIEIRSGGRRDIEAATAAFNRGFGYHRRGDLDRAIFDYLRAIEADNRYVLAYYNLGDVYRLRDDLDLARDAYARAMDISPDDRSIRYNLAIVLDQLGESTAARDQLIHLLSREPDDAACHYLLGLVYSREPAAKLAARAHFEKFIELKPADPKIAGIRQWIDSQP